MYRANVQMIEHDLERMCVRSNRISNCNGFHFARPNSSLIDNWIIGEESNHDHYIYRYFYLISNCCWIKLVIVRLMWSIFAQFFNFFFFFIKRIIKKLCYVCKLLKWLKENNFIVYRFFYRKNNSKFAIISKLLVKE